MEDTVLLAMIAAAVVGVVLVIVTWLICSARSDTKIKNLKRSVVSAEEAYVRTRDRAEQAEASDAAVKHQLHDSELRAGELRAEVDERNRIIANLEQKVAAAPAPTPKRHRAKQT